MANRILQILMPMAGLGSRFQKAGFTTPKPLLEVDGMPMFRKALTSFNRIGGEKRFIFVIRQEHVDGLGLDSLITNALPEAIVKIIPKMTRGAVETSLMAEKLLDPDNPLVIMDCDIWFESREYDIMINAVLSGTSHVGGGVLTFESKNPRYSYAETDMEGNVIRTAEKQVISNSALAGGYFFASAKIFIDSAKELLEEPLGSSMPEYYVSILYNNILKNGRIIKAVGVDKFNSFGTPEELNAYTQGVVEPY